MQKATRNYCTGEMWRNEFIVLWVKAYENLDLSVAKVPEKNLFYKENYWYNLTGTYGMLVQ